MVRERARQDKEVKRLRALLLQQQSLRGGPLDSLPSADGDREASPQGRSSSSSPCSRGEALGGAAEEEEKLRQKVALLEEALIQSSELQRKKQLESQQQIDSLEKRIEYYEDFLVSRPQVMFLLRLFFLSLPSTTFSYYTTEEQRVTTTGGRSSFTFSSASSLTVDVLELMEYVEKKEKKKGSISFSLSERGEGVGGSSRKCSGRRTRLELLAC